MRTITAPMPAEIKEGDRLKWKFDNGIRNDCTVQGVHKLYEEGVSIFVEAIKDGRGNRYGAFLRHIRVDLLTHYNGKRITTNIDRSSVGEPKKVTSVTRTRGAEPFGFRSTGEEEMAVTKTRKSLDEMSESHRAHIEKWEPHLDNLRGEHVWAAVMRVPGRGAVGPCYVAVKRGAKDYVIVDYDTEKQLPATPKRVLEDGFESSSSLMEAFKKYRQMARDERKASAPKSKASKPPKRKSAPKTKATKAASSKKTSAKKGTRKTRKPAGSKK